MFTLGLTGGIATGKTTATDFFKTKALMLLMPMKYTFFTAKRTKGLS